MMDTKEVSKAIMALWPGYGAKISSDPMASAGVAKAYTRRLGHFPTDIVVDALAEAQAVHGGYQPKLPEVHAIASRIYRERVGDDVKDEGPEEWWQQTIRLHRHVWPGPDEYVFVSWCLRDIDGHRSYGCPVSEGMLAKYFVGCRKMGMSWVKIEASFSSVPGSGQICRELEKRGM